LERPELPAYLQKSSESAKVPNGEGRKQDWASNVPAQT
jgi:hypothetical protein